MSLYHDRYTEKINGDGGNFILPLDVYVRLIARTV